MKFTLSWLKDHLQTEASIERIVEAMTMAGLEVEQVEDPAAKLAAFSVARVISAGKHPNADKLQVCRAETKDGVKEIVCGAPNARAGLVTAYAPIGAYIPGTGVTLEARPVRGVVPAQVGLGCSVAPSRSNRASVVLPTWRGPPTKTMRSRRSSSIEAAR